MGQQHSPLYEIYRSIWNLSATVVILIFSVYAFALIVTLLLFGQLSDQVGRLRPFAPSPISSAPDAYLPHEQREATPTA